MRRGSKEQWRQTLTTLLGVIVLLLTPIPGSSGALQKKLDKILRDGILQWDDCRVLDDLKKNDLLTALDYQDVRMRECVLRRLTSYKKDLTKEDIAKVALTLTGHVGDSRKCMYAGEILGSRISESSEYLLTALRGNDDAGGICAAEGILHSAGPADSAMRKEARQRILNCALHCAHNDSMMATNLIIHIDADELHWLETTLSDVTLSTNTRQIAAYLWHDGATDADLLFGEKLLADRQPGIRFLALEFVAGLNSEHALADVIGAVHDPDTEVRMYAGMRLRQMERARVLPMLYAGLVNPDDTTKRDSICILAAFGEKGSLPRLVALLRSGDAAQGKLTPVEMAAGSAVASITGTKSSFPARAYCEAPALSATAEASAEGIAERKRLLAWWDADGAKLFGSP